MGLFEAGSIESPAPVSTRRRIAVQKINTLEITFASRFPFSGDAATVPFKVTILKDQYHGESFLIIYLFSWNPYILQTFRLPTKSKLCGSLFRKLLVVPSFSALGSFLPSVMAYQISTTIRSKQRMQQEKNAKVCIRMATVFFAGVALIIEAAFKNNNPGVFDGWDDSFVFFLYPQILVSLVLAVFWSGAELIFLKLKGRSIHPGAHVAVDLLIFLGLMSAAVLWLMLDTPRGPNNFRTSLAEAAVAFFVIVSSLEFVLFVWACVDTERLRKRLVVPDGMALVPVYTLTRLHQQEYEDRISKV